jgi:hypothetical protein
MENIGYQLGSNSHPEGMRHSSPSPPRSLVRDGQASPHRPRLVVSRSTCPPLSPSPHANSFIIGTTVINTHTCQGRSAPQQQTLKRRSLQSTVPIRDDRRRALLNGDQDKPTIPPVLRTRFVSSHGPCHISRSTYLHPDKYSQPPPCALVRDLLPR